MEISALLGLNRGIQAKKKRVDCPSTFFRFSSCWHCTTSTSLESYLHVLQVLSPLVGIEQRHARYGQPFLQVQQKPDVGVEKVFVGFAPDLQVIALVKLLNDFKANEFKKSKLKVIRVKEL